MTTNETYIARLRKLIAEAPDGLDVSPLEVALASAEAALASSDSTGDRTKIWFLLDRSGSMSHLTGDVIGGFNEFLEQQKAQPGKARMSVVLFDGQNPYEVVVDGRRIAEVPALTAGVYQARSSTPLFDALGTLLERADQRISQRAETGRKAEDQLVLIFTDGHENASSRFDRARVFEMIKDRQDAGNWTFVFMGANQDAYATGGGMGFDPGSTQNYRGDGTGTRSSWDSVNMAVSEFRNSAWEEKQRRKADFFAGQKDAEVDDLNR